MYRSLYYPEQKELTPKQVATVFRTIKGINKDFIGKYFEKRDEFRIQVLKEYLTYFIQLGNFMEGFLSFPNG